MTPRILPLAVTAALLVSSQAHAQQAGAQARPQVDPNQAAAQAAQASPTGPLVPGLCVLDSDRVAIASTVGQYAARRLEELQQQVNTELTTAQTTAQSDLRTLEGQRATLGEQNFVAQANQIAGRFDQLRQVRTAELRETQGRAEVNIMTQATPLIIDTFKSKNCSVMLHANSVVLRADSMDVTQEVITRLNAKLTQFPIERVQIQLQQGAAGAAPGGAPPVAQTPAAGGRPAAPAGGARAPQGPTR